MKSASCLFPGKYIYLQVLLSLNMTPTACKNCSTLLTGNFCHECGQKANIHRITLSHLLHEFFHALTHADKGVLFLAKELIYKPGIVAREYVAGKQKKYFNPLTFLVLVSAVFALITLKSGYFQAIGDGNETHDYGSMPARYVIYMNESTNIFVNHGKLISLVVMVPVLTFLSWSFFRKSGYNFAENLVLQSLIIAQIHLAMVVLFIPAYLLFGHAQINNNIFQVCFFIYMAIAFRQFFQNSILLTIIKTIFVQFLFIILFWMLVLGFVIIKHQVA